MKTKKLIFILMFIILFAGISCVSAVSENVMNNELQEIDSNNLISVNCDEEKLGINENDSALIAQSESENEILGIDENNDNILKSQIKKDTILIGKDYTLNHKPMPYIVYLKDKNNNPLKDLTVKFTVNGASYLRTTGNDGSARLNINLPTGNYQIAYLFEGNTNYNAVSGKSTLRVVTYKLPSSLTANDLSKYYNEQESYKVFLKDNNGNPLVNENILLTINGVTYTRTTGNNGESTLNINLKEGKYTIMANYNGNSHYNSASKSNTITINKKTTSLKGSDLTKFYGDTTPYTVQLLDNQNKPLSNMQITINVNGVNYYPKTDNTGKAIQNINLKEGKYTITTNFNGNDYYKKSSTLNTITINKKTTSLKGSDLTKFYGDTAPYTVQLLDNQNKPMPSTQVTINVNGVNYYPKTDNSGKAIQNINLKEGKYTITTNFNGNDYYKSSIIKNTLTVNKKSSTISGSNLVKFYGDNAPYTVKLQDGGGKLISGANIYFTINGVTYDRTTDNNGVASLSINLKEGSYPITSAFKGNDYYKGSSTLNTITINKKTTSLKGSDLTKFYGDTTPYTVQLLDNQNKPMPSTQVTINVNGVNYYPKTDNSGKVTQNINLKEGKYTITTNFNGNDYYKSSIIKNTVAVNKKSSTISGSNLVKFYGDNAPYTVKLQDGGGKLISGANIYFTINGVTYDRTTDNNGVASLSINLKEGSYPITSAFKGNDYYKGSSTSNTITINKKTTSLKGSDLTKFYGDTTPYTVQLLDNQNKPLSNMQITINVNGVNYYPKTDNSGKITQNINLKEGKYTITTNFNGNDYYKKSSTLNTITINKKTTSLKGSDLTKFYGDTTPYTVQLLDNQNKPMPSTQVTINVNGVNYNTKTDNSGKVTQNINLKEGKYTITTIYNGDDYYKSSSIKNTVAVNKKSSTISGSNLVKFYGDNAPYTVKLQDGGGKLISGANIYFTINGVTYDRTTDNNGVASLSINLKEGSYPITSVFNGNDYYKSSSIIKNTVTINKKTTTLKGNDLTKFYGDTTPYTVQLLDNQNKPMPSTQVTINVNGVNYYPKTDNNGKATQNINLKEGKYTITTIYNGDDYYKSSSIKNTVAVNKKSSTISGSNLVKFYGDNAPYTVKLQDGGGKLISGANIYFTINGVTYDRTTDNNGVASLSINLKEGSYPITSVFNGNDYYKSSSINNTVTVNKKVSMLIGSDLTIFYGDNSAYTVQLLDNNKKAISNAQIIINVNGVDYERTTDNSGKATLNINLKEGIYTITTKYDGNDYYKSSSINNTVTVNKKSTFLKANDLTKYANENTKFQIQLCSIDGEKLANRNIVVNVNNKNYNELTDKNGYVYLNMDLPVGNYVITSKFTGDDYYKESIIKNLLIIEYYVHTPVFSVDGGYYDVNNLIVNISSNDPKSTVFYSLNNASLWLNQTGYVCLNLTNGNWTIKSFVNNNGINSSIVSKNYIIDNTCPMVFVSNGTGVYKNSLKVQLTSIDNIDENPVIYYSLNGSNFILYQNLINISKTTSLNFYAIDFYGHKSEVKTCNYIFEKVGNLNSGKGFNTIQSAIDDANTNNGDLIMVSEGLYNEQLTINKFINLIGVNAELYCIDSSRPVICVSNGGSNSTVQGFKIKDSDYGVVVYQAENVSIINNHFINVVTSIETDHDKNTIIAYNSIDSNKFINSMSGIVVRKSDNLMILNNNITLNSKNNVCGIFVLNNTSKNISIVNNQISNKNKLNGFGLYAICSNMNIESNNISDFNTGFYVVSSNSNILHNEFKNNRYGVFLRNSVNNTYAFNNIHDNMLYGFVLDESVTSDDSFYLNRLFGNAYYDFYSNTNCPYVIDNNWWGENTPKISKNSNIHANIYNKTGNLVMNSWMVVNLFSSSYKINEYSQIERAKFYVDLTYNNLGKKLSSQGYIPNNMESFISVFNIVGDNKVNSSYLKDGKAFVDFELSDLFKNQDNIGVMAFLDNEKIVKTFNKNATIDITLFSTAGDVENNYFVNRTYHIPYMDNVSWVTFSWAETGLYTGKIYVIVNGDIIDEINIENVFYHEFKNSYSTEVFEAIKLLNNVFASMKEGVWEPNAYYLNFAKLSNIDASNFNLVYNRFLNYLKLCYDLNDYELNFVKSYKNCFIDKVEMFVDYHGEVTPDINFEYNGPQKLLNLPSSYTSRVSNIYYTNIEDENNESIGYEGMRSFAIVKGNLTSDDLGYWLNQKELYTPGLMKAAYGTFLTPLLVIYENDRVADESASKFNVTWSRVSPVCVSLCNDYNCLYITGDSNHIMGREAVGNASGVWKFNFATSFSFSLIEQLVGNNVWNSTKIGSVTLGLIESYMNNETLELFASNGYIFIKHALDNNTLLFLDLKTGIVRDCFSYYGLLGTMPCYHDNITDNAWNYGNNLLDKVSKEFSDLKIIFGISVAVADLVGNGLLFEGLGSILAGTTEVLAGISLGTAVVITIPLFIVLFPDYANALWKDFMYLLNPNYKEYPNIPIYENNNYYNNQILVLNIQLLDDYTKSQFIRAYSDENFDWKNVDYYHCVNILNYNYKFAPGGPKPINESFFEVGKFIKEDVDLLVRDIANSNYKGIIKNIAKIGIAVYLTSLTILHYLKTLIKK